MPIQVNEIIIRAVVDAGGGRDESKAPADDTSREDIVSECVEQVLEILNSQKER